MTDVHQMKQRVEAAVKRVDPEVMTGTFYDDASDRLFVTIVKGSRKDLCDSAVAGLWERRRGKDRSSDQGWTQTTSRHADRLTLRPDRSSFE